jgi:hypothetical protein
MPQKRPRACCGLISRIYFNVAASTRHRLDGGEQIGAATGCLLRRGFLPGKRNLHLSHLGAHSPKLGDRTSIGVAPDHSLPIGHDFMFFRGGCVGSVEIPTGWGRNMYLLPDPLSQG